MTEERAIAIAAEAHEGEPRNDPSDNIPYIVHPLTLMLQMQTPTARMAAVLHDVVEDAKDWTFERLEQEGCPAEVMEALHLLTHLEPEPGFKTKRDDETLEAFFHRLEVDYLGYIEQLADHPIARAVKWADLNDNIGDGYPTRQCDRDDPQRFQARMQRYEKAKAVLRDRLQRGNPKVLLAGMVGGTGIVRIVASDDGGCDAEKWVGSGWEPCSGFIPGSGDIDPCSLNRLLGAGIPRSDLPIEE